MRPTRAVYDASVVVRALIDNAPDAVAWIQSLRDGKVRVVAPDLIYAEVANACLEDVRAGELTLADAIDSLVAVSAFPLETRESRVLCGFALPVAVDAGLTAYDAHYLALAEAEDAVLVTADRALAAAARSSVLLE